MSTFPPACSALPAASSALSTHTYMVHAGVGGIPSGSDPTAATSRPRSWATW
jgi:hypothetical protein